MSSDHFLGRKSAATCLIAGPLIMAVAVVLWGYTTDRTDGVAWVQRVQDNPALAGLSENLVTVGAVMTLLAITWLTQHVAAQGATKARLFGTLIVVGHIVGLVFGGMSLAVRQLASGGDPATVGPLVERIYEGPEFTLGFLNPPLIAVGYVGLAVVAARAGVLPTWRAIALALTITFPIGIIGGITVVSVISFACLACAIAPFGVALLRQPGPADRHQPVGASA